MSLAVAQSDLGTRVALVFAIASCTHQAAPHGDTRAAEAPTSEKHDIEKPLKHAAHDAKDCENAIRALAAGRIERWQGLPEGCTRADVERALSYVPPAAGASVAQGSFEYPPTSGAPHGVDLEYADDEVLYVVIVDPKIPSAEQTLGRPDGVIPSRLEGAKEQWVYASRGLSVHMDRWEPGVVRLYAFAPTTLEEFQDSALSQVKTRRYPRADH